MNSYSKTIEELNQYLNNFVGKLMVRNVIKSYKFMKANSFALLKDVNSRTTSLFKEPIFDGNQFIKTIEETEPFTILSFHIDTMKATHRIVVWLQIIQNEDIGWIYPFEPFATFESRKFYESFQKNYKNFLI